MHDAMATRLLPRTLPELLAHAIILEREAAKRFAELERFMRGAGMDYLADEFEAIGKEEREQYELIALGTSDRQLPEISPWEYAWHFFGPDADKVGAPRNAREALVMAISIERRTQNFYADVAENVEDDSISAFAADMAADETRHLMRLEQLLLREPVPVLEDEAVSEALPAKS
jgi:rubrerythrin